MPGYEFTATSLPPSAEEATDCQIARGALVAWVQRAPPLVEVNSVSGETFTATSLFPSVEAATEVHPAWGTLLEIQLNPASVDV